MVGIATDVQPAKTEIFPQINKVYWIEGTLNWEIKPKNCYNTSGQHICLQGNLELFKEVLQVSMDQGTVKLLGINL